MQCSRTSPCEESTHQQAHRGHLKSTVTPQEENSGRRQHKWERARMVAWLVFCGQCLGVCVYVLVCSGRLVHPPRGVRTEPQCQAQTRNKRTERARLQCAVFGRSALWAASYPRALCGRQDNDGVINKQLWSQKNRRFLYINHKRPIFKKELSTHWGSQPDKL